MQNAGIVTPDAERQALLESWGVWDFNEELHFLPAEKLLAWMEIYERFGTRM